MLNMHTQEVVKDAKILHLELLLKGTNSSLEQRGGGSCQHNVINIEQEVDSVCSTMIDGRQICCAKPEVSA